jgi:hypothetical protein
MTPRAAESGSSVIETVVATALLLIVLGGVASMGIVAMTTTENQGHLSARATEYAQDKMEQLLALSYGDISSDTRVFPATDTGGTGLAVGGNSNPSSPVSGYVDYLDRDGGLLTSSGTTPPATWFYKRVWQVTLPSTNLKQITVTVIVASTMGHTELQKSTVVALKTYPF